MDSIPLTKRRGEVLFAPGAPCPGFVMLNSGTLRVTLTGTNGREVVLYRVGPGEVCLQTFGCLIEGRDYAAQGVAESDLTGTLLPAPAFHRCLAEDASFRARLLSAISQRFHDFEQRVEDVALTGFDARLARALLRLNQAGTVTATHEALAAETASGRAVVSRRLAAFQRQGLVSLGRGQVTLGDLTALRRLSQTDR